MTTERPDRGARDLAERLPIALAEADDAGSDADDWIGSEYVDRMVTSLLANGAVFLPDAAELERLRRIVKRAAGMGLCSQTHHEHLMIAARAALEPEGSAPKKLSIGDRARLCNQDHQCDNCGAVWRVDHYCRYGSALCGDHGLVVEPEGSAQLLEPPPVPEDSGPPNVYGRPYSDLAEGERT